MTRTRRLAASSVLLLVAGLACSDSNDDARPFASDSSSASADASPSGTPTSAVSPPPTSGLPPASPTTSVTPGPTATPLRSAGTDPAMQGGPSALPARRAYVPPQAGRYTYANTGNNKVSGCAVDNRPAPPTTDLRVSAVRGARQEALRGDAEQGTQSTVVEYRDKGIYLVSLVIDQPGLGRIEFRPAQAVLLLPEPATQGQTYRFTMRSTDGNYTVDSSNRVTALKQPVRLGDGTSVSTTTVRSITNLRGTSPIGAVDLIVTTVSSAAADPALAVKEIADTDGTVGPCSFDGHVESLLRSVRPV